ncbi:hypothetical protein NCAS_0E01350 [Naumovozyma castellii]|uniref:Major facilitator superfamily (MFS) profile domain-containing protein n=1 Tax=Naumovozyma castellii TaxID=27288 RepID=G0VFD9_NAUCA|nr:hypothetical protein NCAS_0E01350 [Naumovozyma castellii CBS 4309]CCC70205.1 hypothetical protein NCAS_0E01350 [Naumovozyma castellii CBS 4309]
MSVPAHDLDSNEHTTSITSTMSRSSSQEVPIALTKKRNLGNEETILQENKKNPSLITPMLICLAISFGGFLFGWDIGTIGGIANMSSFKERFGTRQDQGKGTKHFPGLLIGLIIGIFNLSAGVGGVALAKCGDWWGRKRATYFFIFIYSIGLLVQLIHNRAWFQIFIGRLICGLAIGGINVIVPMFISEIAPLRVRGSMVTFYQLKITFGILVGNITVFLCHNGFSRSHQNEAWQIPLGLGFVWAFIVILGLYNSPESAQYLGIKKERWDAALMSTARMNNLSTGDIRAINIVEEMQRRAEQDRLEKSSRRNIFEFIFGKPKLGLRLFIGIMLMIFQQLSGINYFFYYGTTIFAKVGLNDPYTTAIILSSVNFVATFFGIYFVEALRRRTSLVFGSIGMFCCMMIYSSMGSFALNTDGTGITMIVVTCVYIALFAITLGPVTIVLVSELYPMRTKAMSMATCSFANWIMNFLITFLTPLITAQIGFKYGYVFAVCLFFSTCFDWTTVPETKNKTPTEIDNMFS